MSEAIKALKGVPSWVWLAGAGAIAFYIWKSGGIAGAAQGVASGAVGVAAGAASGVVLGIGDAIGVTRTSETLCQKAMREGDNWAASKYCGAGDFLAWQGRGVAKTFDDLFN
jgi:hypothetical protein